MEEISRNLSSLSWWFGVVIVGLVLNIASAYLKAPIDIFFSAISKQWQQRSERSRQAMEAKISELRTSPHSQMLLIAEEMRNRLRHLSLMTFSLLFLVVHIFFVSAAKSATVNVWPLGSLWIATQLTYGASIAMMFFAMHSHWVAASARSLLNQANKNA